MIHGDGADITMAQACGEQPYGALAYVAGHDFDPSDPDDVEAVRAATENDAHARIEALEEENARLRAELSGWRLGSMEREVTPEQARTVWCPRCQSYPGHACVRPVAGTETPTHAERKAAYLASG